MTDAIQKAREAAVRLRENLASFDAEVAYQLSIEGERADVWDEIDVNVEDLRAALAALDAETPATPADVGEEPLAWRIEAHVSDASGKKRMNLCTERLPFHPGEGVKQLSEPAPLYSAAALERVVRERDEARENYLLAHSRAGERDRECFRLEDELDSFKLTVTRVWAALGNPAHEALDGRSISEVVANWKTRATSAEAKLAEARKVIEPFARFQTDASGNTDDPLRQPDTQAVVRSSRSGRSVTFGDFRAARRFLEETK